MHTKLPIILSIILYLWVSIGFLRERQYLWCGAWGCYAMANFFFLLMEIFRDKENLHP